MNLLDNENLRWKHYADEAQFDYPISYWGAILGAREDGHVDLLYRWDPHSACHLHRHTAAISSLVLEGELTVIDIDLETGNETGRVVKTAGTWVHKAPGEVHIEIGGTEGALVLFSLYAPEGSLVEGLARDGEVLDHQTLDRILKSKARHEAIQAKQVVPSP